MKLSKLKLCHYIVIASVLVFISLIGLQIYSQNHGGYSIDPTDPSNYYYAIIKNNLNQRVTVSWINDCSGSDPHCDKSWNMKSGQTVSDQALRGYKNRYRIFSQSHKLLGCLSISYDQSQTHGDVELLTTNYQPCSI